MARGSCEDVLVTMDQTPRRTFKILGASTKTTSTSPCPKLPLAECNTRSLSRICKLASCAWHDAELDQRKPGKTAAQCSSCVSTLTRNIYRERTTRTIQIFNPTISVLNMNRWSPPLEQALEPLVGVAAKWKSKISKQNNFAAHLSVLSAGA